VDFKAYLRFDSLLYVAFYNVRMLRIDVSGLSVLDPRYFGMLLDELDCGFLQARHSLNFCGGYHLRDSEKEASHSRTKVILLNSKIHFQY